MCEKQWYEIICPNQLSVVISKCHRVQGNEKSMKKNRLERQCDGVSNELEKRGIVRAGKMEFAKVQSRNSPGRLSK